MSKANRGSWSSALHHRYPKDQTLPVDNAQGSRRSSPAEALQARIPRSREGQASLSFTLLNVTSAHRDSVERITKMFSTGDTSTAAAVFAPNYLDHQGLGEPVKGPGAFEDVVAAARRSYDELAVRIVDAVAEGDKIAVRLRWNGRRGGKEVVRETIDLLRLENGKVVEHWGSRLWTSEESASGAPPQG